MTLRRGQGYSLPTMLRAPLHATLLGSILLAGSACPSDDPGSNATETEGDSATTGGDTDTDSGTDTDVFDPANCGNGDVDFMEECDDGNMINGDGCNEDCLPSGQPQWAQTHDEAGADDCANGVGIDSDGNVVVVGYIGLANGTTDIWIRKYSAEGEELWTETSNGPPSDDDQALAVALDAAGNVTVTGFVTGTLGQGKNIWVRQYPAAGGDPVWTDVFEADFGGDDIGRAIATNDTGYVVAGEVATDVANSDIWIRRYDLAGMPRWTSTYAGTIAGFDSAQGAAIAAGGDSVVAGWDYDETEGQRAWVRKLDGSGDEVWTQTFNAGASEGNAANDVTIDSAGNVVVTGTTRMGSLSIHGWTAHLDESGAEQWVDDYTAEDGVGDANRGVAVDADDHVLVVGTFRAEGSAENSSRLARLLPNSNEVATNEILSDVGVVEARAVVAAPDRVAVAGCVMVGGQLDAFVSVATP